MAVCEMSVANPQGGHHNLVPADKVTGVSLASRLAASCPVYGPSPVAIWPRSTEQKGLKSPN